jgi:hypothetical protein
MSWDDLNKYELVLTISAGPPFLDLWTNAAVGEIEPTVGPFADGTRSYPIVSFWFEFCLIWVLKFKLVVELGATLVTDV